MRPRALALALLLAAGCRLPEPLPAVVTGPLSRGDGPCLRAALFLDINGGAAAPAGPERRVDLVTALAVAGIENPTIALAQEAVTASQAIHLQAQALLLPSLQAGASFNWHEGALESAQGIIRDVQRQSAYVGGGAVAVGAGTVGQPAVRLVAPLGDAFFEPRATRLLVEGRQFDAAAVRNRILLDVAAAYLRLIGAEARLRAIRESEADFLRIAELTRNFAKAGQGREADAQRALSELELLHAAAVRLEEDEAVAAADLARLLSADAAVRLRGPGGPVLLLQLVDPHVGLEELVQTAVANRPEIAARSADVAALEARLRKELVRPLLPTVSVGFSAGGFGGGGGQADSGFGHFGGRTDFDVSAVWTLQGLGFGNLALQNRARALVGEAGAERERVIDAVRSEVVEAHALVTTRLREVDIARRRAETANRAYQQDLARAKNLEGRPIEVLNSANLLCAARQDYLGALIGYDEAELRLFVALGQPPPTP
jgi:outer membrane protein TolC